MNRITLTVYEDLIGTCTVYELWRKNVNMVDLAAELQALVYDSIEESDLRGALKDILTDHLREECDWIKIAEGVSAKCDKWQREIEAEKKLNREREK